MRVRTSPPFKFKVVAWSLATLPLFVIAAPVASKSSNSPIFIQADKASVKEGEYSDARGNVVVNRDDLEVHSDWLKYELVSDKVSAGDQVVMTQNGDKLEGTRLDMTVDTRLGEMDNPIYHMAQNAMRGNGVKVLFEGKDKYRVQNGRMTTCRDDQDDWYINARELELDYTSNYGQAWHGWAEFQGVPFFYYPWVDFPLDGGRKSGFLMPSLAFSNTNGFEYSQPFYWNIAPNYDATIIPSYFGKRGVMLGGEFRYLQPSYNGILRAEGINDQETNTSRYSTYFQHSQSLTDRLHLNLTDQKVSDDDYFNDFADRLSVASQVNLEQGGTLSYNGDNWSSYIRVQKYQTLQNSVNPVEIPYSRLPQWYFTTNPQIGYGAQTNVTAEITRFSHPTQTQGDRAWVYPTVSWPLANSYAFLTPKIGVHASTYRSETASGQQLDNENRVLPIASLDSGLFFEREANLFGSNVIQTLEPRLYYLYVPYKSQSNIPIYDTGVADLSWSQLFSENKFTGNDRINDANEITLAVNTRIFDDENGVEQFYAGIGQKYYFETPRVNLTGPDNAVPQQTSDMLFTLGGNFAYDTHASYTLQQNLKTNKTVKADLNLNWTPGEYKTLNLRYSVNRTTSTEQVDFSGQWPLGGGWYGVGRYNYSLKDNQALETLAGVEYNAGCWALRFAAQKYVTTNSEYKINYFAVLELGGLAGLGMNPISTLRQSIPGYADTYRTPNLR